MVWGVGGGSPADCVGGIQMGKFEDDISLPGQVGERAVEGKWSAMSLGLVTEGTCSSLCFLFL